MDKHDMARWRKQQTWTQHQLAWVLGVNPVTVSHWESGRRDIPVPMRRFMYYIQRYGADEALMRARPPLREIDTSSLPALPPRIMDNDKKPLPLVPMTDFPEKVPGRPPGRPAKTPKGPRPFDASYMRDDGMYYDSKLNQQWGEAHPDWNEALYDIDDQGHMVRKEGV